MAKLDYKQKYKQLTKFVRELYPFMTSYCKEKTQAFFSSLEESEDEKVRKALIDLVKCNERSGYKLLNNIPTSSMIAWLEKHSEKFIPEDIDKAALQYVDTCTVDGEITHDNVTEPYWNNHSMMNAYKAGWLEKQGELKSANKVEPEPYFYCKYGGTMSLCSDCKRNHSNSTFKTEEITTWHSPGKSTKHCTDYIGVNITQK